MLRGEKEGERDIKREGISKDKRSRGGEKEPLSPAPDKKKYVFMYLDFA